MREVLAAMGDQEGRGRLDVENRARRAVVRLRPEEPRPRTEPAAFAEAEDARDRQTAPDDAGGQAALRLPVSPHREQGGVVAARRVPADEDALGIAAHLRDVPVEPGDGVRAVLETGGERMLGREPVADAGIDDAARRRARPGEVEMLLVARGPAAAVHHREHGAVGLNRRLDGDRPVRIAAVTHVHRRNALAARHDLVGESLPDFAQRFLRRVVLDAHGLFPTGRAVTGPGERGT